MKENRKIIITDDGSSSLSVPSLHENYHSTFGAITESEHIYIRAGFEKASVNMSSIRVFEMGFGTGLNCFLTLVAAISKEIKVHYYTVDNYIIPEEIVAQLNYNEKFDNGAFKELYKKIMVAPPWDTKITINEYFTLHKVYKNVDASSISDLFTSCYNLVYYDAFAPQVNPQLWLEPVIAPIVNAMDVGGVFVTYCCKGEVRRLLQKLGMQVEKLQGPPGKREILRGVKIQSL